MKIYQFDQLDPSIIQSDEFQQAVEIAFQNLFSRNAIITEEMKPEVKKCIQSYLDDFYQGDLKILDRIKKGQLTQVLKEYPLWYFSCIEAYDSLQKEFFQRWKKVRPGTYEWYVCPHQCQDVAYIIQTYCSLK